MAGSTIIQERTTKMKENYVHLHFEKGLSPKEIARHYGLSVTTVYKYLGEIAAKSGYTREELLEAPEHSGERSQFNGMKRIEPIDLEGIKQGFAKAKEALNDLIGIINEAERGENNDGQQ